MRKAIFILIFIQLCHSVNLFAQRNNDTYESWKTAQNYIYKEVNKTIKGNGSLWGISQKDVDSWKKCCDKIESNYKKMLNKESINDNVINEWKSYNNKILKALKNGWPNITSEQANLWEQYCKKFENKYNALKRSTSKNGNSDRSTTRLPSAKREQINISTNNEDLLKASTEAFELCLYLPLAVKYDKKSTERAYQIAENLINAGVNDSEALTVWAKFGPLLKEYNKYNKDVIQYIESIKAKVMQKGGYINSDDVNTYRILIEYDLKEYYHFYNKDVSIKYLDDVLNEFFDLLENYAENERQLQERVFNNFILNNLNSDYNF